MENQDWIAEVNEKKKFCLPELMKSRYTSYENDFSLIGEMTKLKQLPFHDVAIDDYSFLARCINLNTLDLLDTSFSDCRLLAGLPALKKVFLTAYSQPPALKNSPMVFMTDWGWI